jgi:WD40 repeat protein
MYRAVTLVALTTALFTGRVGVSSAQEPNDVPAAKLQSTLPQSLRSAELHFTPDGSKLLVLRYFGNHHEPQLSAYSFGKGVSELPHPLVGADLFGKAELALDRYGPVMHQYRLEGLRVVFSPRGRLFLTSSLRTVRLWEIATPPSGQGSLKPYSPPIEHAGSVLAAFTQDGKRLLTATVLGGKGGKGQGQGQYQVRLWEVDTGNPVGEPATGAAPGNSKFGLVMKSLLWAPDEKTFLLAYGGERQEALSLLICDARTLQPVGEPWPVAGDYHQFGRDGKTLLVVSAGEISLWDIATRKLLSKVPWAAGKRAPGRTDKGHPHFAVHPDGTSVLLRKAADGKQVVEWWDLRADPPVKKQTLDPGGFVDRVALSGDGKRAATATADAVLVWDLAAGRPLLRVAHDQLGGRLQALEFSPDGRRLATANDRGDVKLWGLDIQQ